jgi:hypothetical protein
MSPSIWTRCGGRSNALELGCEPWRVVEGQRIAATRPLVDTDAEQAILEQLIDAAKPALPPGQPFAGLHYLLYSAFRYPPLRHGSRFGSRHEPSLWYGAEALRTSLAEAAYYRILFFEGTTAKLAPHSMPMSAFQARVRTKAAIDVSTATFKRYVARICSPSDYSASQALGSEMRAHGIEAVRFPSARDPDHGPNVGLFTPAAFASRNPLRLPETWLCTVTAAHDVEFRHERISGIASVGFRRSEFLVKGALPAPAT